MTDEPCKILLFQDHQDAGIFLDNLKSTSFSNAIVTCPDNLNQGFQLLDQQAFELIFIDLAFTKIDMVQLTQIWHELIQFAPVIVITSPDHQWTEFESIEKDSDFCLNKTALNQISLERVIRRHLDRWKLQHKLMGTVENEAITERKRLEEALQDKEEKYRTLIDTIPGTVYRCALDQEWTVMFLTEAILDLTGYPASDFVNNAKRSYASVIHPEDTAMVEEAVMTAVKQKKTYTIEYRILHASGQIRWCWERGQAHFDQHGDVDWLDGIFFDITEERRIGDQLRQAASVFSHVQEAIMITAMDGEIIDVNPAFTRITGYTREEVLGKTPKILNSGQHDQAFYADMWRELIENGHWAGEIWNRRKSGDVFVEWLTISRVFDQKGQFLHYVALFSDITRIKEHERELERIAHFDNLTGLPNRVLLADRLHQATARAQRNGNKLAVVFLDLDGFKAVNDNFGHGVGDALLIEVSQRLLGSVREGDTVARLGGDEFVILLCDIASEDDCQKTLQRILLRLILPYKLADQPIDKISGSIGYTMFPDDNSDSDTLLRHADHAMYSAKQAGKNRYFKFDTREDKQIQANWMALNRIEKALKKGEFSLYIQPKIHLHSGQVVGAEALIRWLHPIRGLVPPAEFLPLIKDNDIALKIDQWVILEGLRLMKGWDEQGLDLPLSVNVSARQLREPHFYECLATFLQRFPDIPPGKLELEIVESAALDDLDKVSDLIAECQELGVKFALDDFGTGYSTLTYLKRLNVSTLKIDQSFVRDLLVDENDLAIVCGVIGLASAFKSHTVAEGVESLEQAAFLLDLGCEMAQGYIFAHPMPAEEIAAWINCFKMPDLKEAAP